MNFVKWNSIDNMRTFYNDIIHYKTVLNKEFDMSFTFEGKVKLHGTNASISFINGEIIAGKRTGFITKENDNCGFASWLDSKKLQIIENVAWSKENVNGLILYGEWIGPGVQNGVAASSIKNKVFAVFSVNHPNYENEIAYCDSHWPWMLAKTILKNIQDVYFIEPTVKIDVDFDNKESVNYFKNKIEEMVNVVCDCDPFIYTNFGVEGPGEGLVFYSTRVNLSHSKKSRHLFKVKGEKFSEVKQKSITDLDFEKISNIMDFAKSICTMHRLEKKFDEYENPLDIRNIGQYLKIVSEDVLKECEGEISHSGFTWKEISKSVTKLTADYYREKIYNTM